jgi:flagellar basal body-associated protein FliL
MNKREKITNIALFIIIVLFLTAVALTVFLMPAQAKAYYSEIEAMTPVAIERKRVREILNE